MSRAEQYDGLKREIERNLSRARNGLKYFSGGRFVRTNASSKDVIWAARKAELWQYRSDNVKFRTPVLLHIGLVSKSYIFDLHPANSVVQRFLHAGFDVYLLDWGISDEADAKNSVATYALELLPRAVRALLKHSGEKDINLVSYCMGGCLSLTALGCGEAIPCRSLTTMAVPIDFTKMGDMYTRIRQPDFDVNILLDETGNVSPGLLRDSVRLRTPMGDAVQYANLLQHMWNDNYMVGFQALNEWIGDHVPLPGGVLREIQKSWLADNGFMTGKLKIAGRPVDLGSIKIPVLCIVAERDELVTLEAAIPLPQLLTGADLKVEILQAGHIGLVCGKSADQETMPVLIDWLTSHSDPVRRIPR